MNTIQKNWINTKANFYKELGEFDVTDLDTWTDCVEKWEY